MMGSEIIMVCGLGRCGSSLVMQMLAAGGVPVTGDAPAYEDDCTLPPVDWSAIAERGGTAFKFLTLQDTPIPMGFPGIAIWLDRDKKEQAASQAKLLRMMVGVKVSRAAERGLAATLPRDRNTAVDNLRRAGIKRIDLTFEAILGRPDDASNAIAAFLGRDMNLSAMADVVVRRDPKCAPGLALEATLLNAALERGQ